MTEPRRDPDIVFCANCGASTVLIAEQIDGLQDAPAPAGLLREALERIRDGDHDEAYGPCPACNPRTYAMKVLAATGDSAGPLDVERLARALSNAAEARQPTISADYRTKAEKIAAEYARLSSREAKP